MLLTFQTFSQEVPPIINYTPSDYGGDTQNWSASQGSDGFIYIANNKGLLSFNGAQWNLYPSPNETILRSVIAHKEFVYTGAHRDFGKWVKDSRGRMIYTSLTQTLNIQMLPGEELWKILVHENKIIFQSLRRLFVYDPLSEEVNIINISKEPKDFRLIDVDGLLVFQLLGEGLFTLKDGKPDMYSSDPIFKTKAFINFFKRADTWIGISKESGIYTISNSIVEPLDHPSQSLIKEMPIYSAISLEDGGIAIGSITKGFFKLSSTGDILYNAMQGSGLTNNTVLSLFQDKDENIWIGMDNGIACINSKSSIENYIDFNGTLGTTYSSVVYKEDLYIGTNQGLFRRNRLTKILEPIPGMAGQVWTLRVLDGKLFCGHHKGTFIINGKEATLVSDVKGTWEIRNIEGRDDILIQGNYNGLYILEEKEGVWEMKNKIEGFDSSSKHFAFASNTKVLVSNEYEGVYEVVLNDELTKATEIRINKSVTKGEHAGLEVFEGNIYYATKRGFYIYNNNISSFKRIDDISKILVDGFVSGKMVNDSKGSLWIFMDDKLLRLTNGQLRKDLSINEIYLSEKIGNSNKGYENVNWLETNKYLLGTTNGFRTFKTGLPKRQFEVAMHAISQKSLDGEEVFMPISIDTILPNSNNTLQFSYYTLSFQKSKNTEYQYRLLGFYDEWSEWCNDANVTFSNIPSGDYTFEVRGKVGGVKTQNSASYNFRIKKAWYASKWAIIAYVFFGLLILIIGQWVTSMFYRKQRRNLLEKTKREMDLKSLGIEKENIQLRNDNLRNEITARNRELATVTLGIVDRNNTLNAIKEELLQLTPNREIKSVIAQIDKNLTASQDWNEFEEAFNRADKDFFKKVKEVHPNLTSNDLKLCVYLRLNMTSKEIAPLLNISYRSVEIKRYRLRKKIELDHSVNLNDYFINL